jgi:DNA-binding IclR family transcriptional regulator
MGKVLLAYNADATRAVQAGKLDPFTRRTLVRPEHLIRALTQVRDQGWAAEVEEMTPGEAGIAAPIRGYGGLVVGAIGVSGVVERLCDSRGRPDPTLVSYVREAARAVSRDLGASRR